MFQNLQLTIRIKCKILGITYDLTLPTSPSSASFHQSCRALLCASQTQQACPFSEVWASYSSARDAFLIGLSHYKPHGADKSIKGANTTGLPYLPEFVDIIKSKNYICGLSFQLLTNLNIYSIKPQVLWQHFCLTGR